MGSWSKRHAVPLLARRSARAAGCGGGSGAPALPQAVAARTFQLARFAPAGPVRAGKPTTISYAGGGVLGHKLELNVLDDALRAGDRLRGGEGARRGQRRGRRDRRRCATPRPQREVDVISASNIPFLVTSATRGRPGLADKLPTTFQMNGTLYQQALSAVFWMNYRRAQRLAVIDDPSPESQTLAKNAIRLVDETPKVVSLQTVKPGGDLDTIAKAAILSKPNFIYWTGAPATGGALAKALHANGYTGTFTASAASESPAFLQAAGPDGAEGAFVTATSTAENTPTAADWRTRFQQRFHHAPGLDALQAYDAVRTLVHATDRAHGTDATAVARQMSAIDVKFTTFLGVMRFAHDHTLLYDNRVILQVRKGAFTWKRSLRTDPVQ